MWLIILGLILVVVGLIVLLPFFGTGALTGGVGDILIDIPVSFVLILIGSAMLLIGGIGVFITQFWWLIPAFLLMYITMLWAKVKFRRRR